MGHSCFFIEHIISMLGEILSNRKVQNLKIKVLDENGGINWDEEIRKLNLANSNV